jgi:hypothetical protein
LQAVALPQMRLPEQAAAVTAWQVPLPLQVCAGVSVETLHMEAAHCVPVGYLRQAPAPLQVPSSPQVEALLRAHWVVGLGA